VVSQCAKSFVQSTFALPKIAPHARLSAANPLAKWNAELMSSLAAMFVHNQFANGNVKTRHCVLSLNAQ
jgi:hypothetical protein